MRRYPPTGPIHDRLATAADRRGNGAGAAECFNERFVVHHGFLDTYCVYIQDPEHSVS
jgi:hypothetical protein